MPGIGIGLGVGLGGGAAGWSDTAIAQALAAKGLSDAQARSVVGSAASLPAGLRSVGLLPPLPAPSPTPSPPAVTPFPAGLAAMWDAATLSLGNGAAVASWTDSVGGVALAQTDPTRRPILAADATGSGTPGVRFDGNQVLTASRAGGAADLAALIDRRTHTTYIVATGIGPSGYGCAFGATAGGDSYFALADGSVLGRFDGNTAAQTVAFTGRGPVAFGFSSTTDPSGGAGSGLQRTYVNGGCVAAAIAAVPATSADFGLGAVASGALGFVGTILYVFVFDRELSPPEMIQLERAWRDRAGLAYPWAGGAFLIALGDSQTMGVGADGNADTYPCQLAQRRGLSPGQWSNLGIGGIAVDLPVAPAAGAQMQGRLAREVGGTAAQLGFAPHFVVGEWYNMHDVAGAAAAGYMATYLATLKATSPGSKIALWTSFTYAGDRSASPDTQRAAYNGYWDTASNRTGKVDVYVPIHADPVLGIAGACPASPPFGSYFSDGIHLTGLPGYPAAASGYPYFADKLHQALSAADF